MPNSQDAGKAVMVGIVTHYFGHVGVAAMKLMKPVKIGDTVRFVGATTDFDDVVRSIQIEHEAVTEAGPGDEIGIKVRDKVREGDRVYVM